MSQLPSAWEAAAGPSILYLSAVRGFEKFRRMLPLSDWCSSVIWVSPWIPNSWVVSEAALTLGSVSGSSPGLHLLLPWGYLSPIYSWSPSVVLLCAGWQCGLGWVLQLGLLDPAVPQQLG